MSDEDHPSTPAIAPPAAEPGGRLFPWEDRALPWPTALVRSVAQLVTQPRVAFERIAASSGAGRAIAFGLIVASVGHVTAIAVRQVVSVYSPIQFDVFHGFTHRPPSHVPLPYVTGMAGMLAVPAALMAGLGVFVFSLLVHGVLQATVAVNRGYKATLRAVCYAQVAELGAILPLLGGLAPVWNVVLCVAGVAALHGISYRRAAPAVLVPAVLALGLTLAYVWLLTRVLPI